MEQIKKILRQQPLKRSFIIIVSIWAGIVLLVSAGASKICSDIYNRIISRHSISFEPIQLLPESNGKIDFGFVDHEGPPGDNGYADGGAPPEDTGFTDAELAICRIVKMLMVILPVIFSSTGVILAASLFYHWKLKEPLNALNQGISQITRSNLDFSIQYREPDELGRICAAFETMREELVRNNQNMWKLVDERKKINASVAHDLRTPITVIKGYSEYLERNLSKGRMTVDNTLEIAAYIRQAAERLENYADSVQDIQTLEEIGLDYREITLPEFYQEAEAQLVVMAAESGRSIEVKSELPENRVRIAPAAVFRILENVFKNACRYCREQVSVRFSFEAPLLVIEISDDGAGFTEQDLKEAFNYFYKDKKEKNHYGIGLTICRILCEKHNGTITLGNVPSGGAKVTVKIKAEPIS